MSCGSCSPGDSPTVSSYSNSGSFTLGDPNRTWTGFWFQVLFPAVPCASPHLLYHTYWRSGMPKYATVTSSTPVKLVSGTNPISIGPYPSTNTITFTFTETGIYRLRVERSCGDAFASLYQEITVISGARSVVLATGASIL